MLNLIFILLAVVFILVVGMLYRRHQRYKTYVTNELKILQKQVESNSLPELREEVTALKKRVITLEAIVTSHGYDLNEKISNLK
ncbi:hypothetical protein tloyanaT_17260 [Thalassotalea loyana]|uniref:Uncharacterized protein n=1 Tax=Thalassotalea loyana TaxID=280483 RepID=A0ABQ6HDF3_9GAMM|nr:hypothetical protein [Thalassotalea loyana]GLX85474.1 hypothetical protein tloyanaT_17260 [Thalassotalea loyana]